MTVTESLEEFAMERDIHIYRQLPLNKDSFAVRVKGKCSIGVTSRRLAAAEEAICLAHELGHCETGSFYNQNNVADRWGRHEYRANKWAIKRLIPKNNLVAAMRAGYTEPWELAERFDVTEAFMRMAIFYYLHGYIV